MELIKDSALDAFMDSLKLIPFLLITYLIMEWLERKTEAKQIRTIKSSGKYGPLIGGLLGVAPQCGFSLVAANLYSGGLITVGVLLAVFMSTSDEMLPMFMSQAVAPLIIVKILASKAAIGISTGYLVDITNKFIKKLKKKKINLVQVHGVKKGHEDDGVGGFAHMSDQPDRKGVHEHKHSHEASAHNHSGAHSHKFKSDEDKSIHEVCENEHCNCNDGIIKSALKHTGKIAVFILVISFAINIAIGIIGEDSIGAIFSNIPVVGELIAGLVGLVPNCAASIIITQLYLDGVLSSGAMMSGLLVSAGVGLMVLFRMNRHRFKENIKLLGTLYIISVAWGILINLIGIKFI